MNLNQILSLLSADIVERQSSILVSRPLIVAIDGRCAAGKTTLAAALEKTYAPHCRLFHLDDFFLRPCQATEERRHTPGRNLDYERFLAEVLLPLRRGNAFYYRPYRCREGKMGDPIGIRPPSIAICEGSYALCEPLRPYYDLCYFLDVSPASQWKRLEKRENEESRKRFRELWIPLEEAYIASERPENVCRRLTLDV